MSRQSWPETQLKIKDMDYRVRFDQSKYHLIADMVEWCQDNLESYVTHYVEFGHSSYFFEDEADAIAFKLHWG